jgi:hypothetical protein
MTPEIQELILDIVGSGEASPYEIAAELCDLAPRAEIIQVINRMIVSQTLVLTEDLFVRIPSAVSNS